MNTLRRCTDSQEWDDFVLDNGGHPLQLWGWGEVKSGKDWVADRQFLIDDNSNVIGAAQILVRRLPWPVKSMAYIPRGPIANKDNREVLLDKLSDYIKTTYKSALLKIEPDETDFSHPNSWIESKNPILPSNTIILDLKRSEDELLGEMVKKTRQYIRKSANEVLIKRLHTKEDLDKCMAIYRDTAKRAKFNLHSDQYYYDVFKYMGDNSVLFAAYSNNQPVAFLWLAISAKTAFELYGGMNNDGQQLRANYALKWHAIKKCKEWGLKRYDFGGLIEGGVSTFKMSWTNEPTKLVGAFDKPLSMTYGILNILLPTAKSLVHKIKSILKR